MWVKTTYYYLKPLIPRRLQIELRRKLIYRKLRKYENIWPIDESASKPPRWWDSWPEKKRFALVLTHDVDTAKGHNNCRKLLEIEKKLGFRSSFNFVPERYVVSPDLRHYLTSNGFEVGVHGLNHDGKLYNSREIFKKRAVRINQYIKEWGSTGFRSPAMHHNLEWIHDLNIEYDASTFDTDPFEPQSDGVGTVFPFWVENSFHQGGGYIEMPYTLPQDFTLFILMKKTNINIWKKKLDWIVERGGMALLNVHPDYINFDDDNLNIEEYPADFYIELLHYVKTKYKNQYWHDLPKEIANYCKETVNNSYRLLH